LLAGPKTLQMCNVHDVHIYNCVINEEEKNPIPPLVGLGLARIGRTQLIDDVHTPHMSGVLQMNWRSENRVPDAPFQCGMVLRNVE
jgi:hypothetical protein